MYVAQSSKAAPCGGLTLRGQTAGPEIEMVQSFLRESPILANLLSSDYDTMLFPEPRIDSGFPDLVFVQYASSLPDSWEPLRNTLAVCDLKVFSDIANHRPSKAETISRRTGVALKQLEISLELLNACRFVEQSGSTWRRIHNNAFGVKRIIAIEAKISNVGEAARQAAVNKRFATESYILAQSERVSQRSLEQCKLMGVGVISDGGNCLQAKARRSALTINHVTMQFNEWVAGSSGRYSIR